MSEIKSPWVLVLRTVAAILLVLTLPTGICVAESTESEDAADLEARFAESLEASTGGSSSAQSASSSGVSTALSKLAVHGFLTQAYAERTFVDVPSLTLPDGSVIPFGPSPTADEIAIGIPENGTTDYRFLALQFRYDMSAKDVFVVQFSSRTLGFSPIVFFEDAIELDWAFYERRITDHTSLKVGRIQLPQGIYNEIRDVGTILPFYRPPYQWYREGTFTSETIDGLALTHTFLADGNTPIELSIYAGEYDQLEIDVTGSPEDSAIARAKDAFGFQLWFYTPIQDLRFGAGLSSRKNEGGIFTPPGELSDTLPTWHASLDGTFNRLTVRSEYQTTSSTLPLPFAVFDLEFHSFYVQLGVQATSKLAIWGQYDFSETLNDSAVFTTGKDEGNRTDIGVSLNYAFLPNVVLKFEYHDVEEESSLQLPIFTPQGFMLDTIPFVADGGDYTIVSMSVSF